MPELAGIQKFNKIFQEYNLEKDEIKVYQIMTEYSRIAANAKQFITLFKKNKDPREAKYWKLFTELHEMYRSRKLDWIIFFLSQFYYNTAKRFIPNYLKANASWARYMKYLKNHEIDHRLQEHLASEKSKVRNIVRTDQFINKWLKEYGFKENDYEAFFTYKEKFDDMLPLTYKYIYGGQVSQLFIVVSKSFKKMYNELDQDLKNDYLTEETKNNMMNIYLSRSEFANFVKGRLGDEFEFKWKKNDKN